MRVALWIVGEPAAGKSTIARRLLGEQRESINLFGQKWTHGDGWMAPGFYPSLSQARVYLERYFAQIPHPPVAGGRGIILDGARFSTRPCFELLRQSHETRVCFVASPECAARRAARGWDPDAAWLKGAITRAERFRDYALNQGSESVQL